jgi:hypothetical protein
MNFFQRVFLEGFGLFPSVQPLGASRFMPDMRQRSEDAPLASSDAGWNTMYRAEREEPTHVANLERRVGLRRRPASVAAAPRSTRSRTHAEASPEPEDSSLSDPAHRPAPAIADESVAAEASSVSHIARPTENASASVAASSSPAGPRSESEFPQSVDSAIPSPHATLSPTNAEVTVAAEALSGSTAVARSAAELPSRVVDAAALPRVPANADANDRAPVSPAPSVSYAEAASPAYPEVGAARDSALSSSAQLGGRADVPPATTSPALSDSTYRAEAPAARSRVTVNARANDSASMSPAQPASYAEGSSELTSSSLDGSAHRAEAPLEARSDSEFPRSADSAVPSSHATLSATNAELTVAAEALPRSPSASLNNPVQSAEAAVVARSGAERPQSAHSTVPPSHVEHPKSNRALSASAPAAVNNSTRHAEATPVQRFNSELHQTADPGVQPSHAARPMESADASVAEAPPESTPRALSDSTHRAEAPVVARSDEERPQSAHSTVPPSHVARSRVQVNANANDSASLSAAQPRGGTERDSALASSARESGRGRRPTSGVSTESPPRSTAIVPTRFRVRASLAQAAAAKFAPHSSAAANVRYRTVAAPKTESPLVVRSANAARPRPALPALRPKVSRPSSPPPLRVSIGRVRFADAPAPPQQRVFKRPSPSYGLAAYLSGRGGTS